MCCADAIRSVSWLGGEAAETGRVPSTITGLQARLSTWWPCSQSSQSTPQDLFSGGKELVLAGCLPAALQGRASDHGGSASLLNKSPEIGAVVVCSSGSRVPLLVMFGSLVLVSQVPSSDSLHCLPAPSSCCHSSSACMSRS